jgi:hypothetical protein
MGKQTPVPANENDLMTAQQARDFVNCFAPVYLGKEASYVTSTGGRLIHFNTMTDEDAIWVAKQFKDWLIQVEKKD